MSSFEKIAKAVEDKKVSPGYIDSNLGAYKAIRSGNKGIDQITAHPELIGERVTGTLKGGVVGGAGGGALGALTGAISKGKIDPKLGAKIGAILGAATGAGIGSARGEGKFLRKRGVHPRLAGIMGYRFTPKAAKKYGVSE